MACGAGHEHETIPKIGVEILFPPIRSPRKRRFANLRLHALERYRRRLARLPGPQPGHDRDRQVVVAWHPRRRPERDDDVDGVTDIETRKTRRRDSHDGERDTVQGQRSTDGVRGSTKMLLPETVADDRDRQDVRGAVAAATSRP